MTTQTPQSFGTSSPAGDPTLTGSEGGASVRERAGQVGGTAKNEAAGVAQEVKYQARDLVGETRQQVRQQVDTQRGRVSDLLREIGEELEQMADRSDRSGLASDLVRQAAVKARDARGYLDGGGDLVEDLRRFARRRPGTFLVGAIAAGVLAGRATRAAAAARQDDRSPDRYRGATGPTYPGEYTGESTGASATSYGAGTTGTAYSTGTTAYPAGTSEYSTGTTEYPTGTTGQSLAETYETTTGPIPPDREERR